MKAKSCPRAMAASRHLFRNSLLGRVVLARQRSALAVIALVVAIIQSFHISSCLCCRSQEPAEFRVLNKSDFEGKQLEVVIEENVSLFCMTNVPWKRCLWKPPRNGVRELRCEFVRGPENMITCPSFPEVHYDSQASESQAHNCAIVVENIQEYHEGQWECEFELDLPSAKEPVFVSEMVKLTTRGFRYP